MNEINRPRKTGQVDTRTAAFMRHVRYRDQTTHRELVFLPNHLELPAGVVAVKYKERWHIELLSSP
jgi:hypothetical protein